MQQLERTALMPHTADQLMALIGDVARYPEFLPNCLSAQVEQGSEPVRASLSFRLAGLTESFATENRASTADDGALLLDMRLLRGPFKSLSGQWRLQALGDAACKVSLAVQIDWGALPLGRLFSGQVERSVHEIIQAFRRRAETLYGRAA